MARPHPIAPASSDAPTRAAVRAAQHRARVRIVSVTAMLLGIAVVVALGIIFVRGVDGASDQAVDLAGQGATAPRDCEPTTLRVTADPSVAPVLEETVADLSHSQTDCLNVMVRAEDSSQTAAALGAGAAPDFDVWMPDSTLWPARATGLAQRTGLNAPELVIGDAVASTPVVFAATRATATALEAVGAGFSSLAGRSVAAVLPDPSTDAASSAALVALQSVVNADARAFTALVLGLAPGIAPTADAALAQVVAATTPTIAVTTEQALLEFDDAGGTLVAVYPTDLQPALSLPLVTRADASKATLDAAQAFSVAVTSGDDRLAAHGLRDADGTAMPDTTGAGDMSETFEPADGANQAEALRTWQVLTAPSRMLSLNDVSGSMLTPATPELRRIDLFEQAAVGAVNSLSANSSLATWVFSSRRVGEQDWQELIPFGSLGDPAHKQLTIDTANGLDSVVGGGTGLYDSVLAAVRYMRETYVAGQVNLVLLNTDGINEDDEGLDLPGLLAELEALRDPANPVVVIAVGYGPDTDQAVLEQIAAATDGAAYQALQPTDIGAVIIDAVTQRGCRPNCG